MAAPYVTDTEILALVGNDNPSADDSAWAAKCAAAIEAEIAHRLPPATFTYTAELEAALHVAAETDGAALYVSRRSPHGVLSVGADGDAVRLGASSMRSLEPIFLRYAGPGIG